MGLLREILAERVVRVPLEFGINENIILLKIDNEPRTYEGEIVRRNTYMTFAKVNEKKDVIAQSEFNYFNLDHEKDADKNWQNLANQVSQLNNIANIVNPGSEVDPTAGFKTEEELISALTTKAGCDKLIKAMYASFEKAVKDHVGEVCPLMRLKLITDNKGKWLQLPNEGNIVENMDTPTKLVITQYELKRKNTVAAPSPITADVKGSAPTAGASALGSLI